MVCFNAFLLPVVLASPKNGWYTATVIAFLTATGQLNFFNWSGRVMGTASMVATMCTPELPLLFQIGNVCLVLLSTMYPKHWLGLAEESDLAHMIVGGLFTLCMAVMVLGLRLRENESNLLQQFSV